MVNVIEGIFGVEKPIIGMVHLLPLPGNYLYDDIGGIEAIVKGVIQDVEKLQLGGVDGIMFCNEHDRPYSFKAGVGTIAAMSYVIGKVKSQVKIPFGVDVLWDPIAALGIAKVAGASFVREIFTNEYAGDMGMWHTNCHEVFSYRKLIKAENIRLFFNINAEFSAPVAPRPLSVVTKSVIMSSLPDALLVSGPVTGIVAKMNLFKEIKENAGEVPVLANTGVTSETVEDILKEVDGAIIGTAFKVDGITWNPVSQERVNKLMQKVNSLRKNLKK